MRIYLNRHKYSTAFAEQFIEDYTTFVSVFLSLLKKIKERLSNSSEILKRINWEKELRGPGLPDPMPVFTTEKIKEGHALAHEYIIRNGERPENYTKYENFRSKIKQVFMIRLTKEKANKQVIERVDQDLDVTKKEQNPDILLYWLVLNIPQRLDKVREKVEEYVGGYGRGKYLYPVYQLLAKADLEFGRKLLKKFGDFYNPKIAENIAAILK